MKKGAKSYLKPSVKFSPFPNGVTLCTGSRRTNFLNEDGTEGFLNSTIEQDINAFDAASRRFDDEEYDEDY